MGRFKLFIPLIIFAVLSIFFWKGLSLDPSAMPSALIDKSFPEFSLPRLGDGNESVTMASRADIVGEITLVNVWATWCVACKVEHPYLNQLAEAGVRIIGLNYKDDSNAARQWLQKLGNPYQWNIVDQEGKLGIDLGVFGAPETYLLDQKGVIRYKHVGVVDQSVWDEKFLPVIAGLTQ
jgi:cytochrome c biogenesis protein CcmG/thiol:disulfide interchange protein DsbE